MVRGRRGARVLAPVLLILIGAGAIPITASAAAADTDARACAQARADLAARRIEQAYEIFVDPDAGCDAAEQAIAAVNTARAERTRALRRAARQLQLAKAATTPDDKATHRELARIAYIEAIEQDAESTKARDGLTALDRTPGEDPFAGSRALLRAGLKTEAKDQLIKEITDGNTLGDTKGDKDLAGLLKDDKSDFDKFRTNGTDFIDDAKWVLSSLAWIAGLVIGVVLFFFLIRVLVNFWVFQPWSRATSRRKADPDAGRIRTWWRSRTRPRLNVQPGDGDAAKLLTARVRTAILELDQNLGTSDLRMASAPEEKLDLASLGEIDSRVKPLLVALELGSRRDTVTVSLSTGKDDGTHTRIAAEAFARKTGRRAETFANKADGGLVTPELVGRATAWTLFSAEAMRARLRDGDPTKTTYGTDKVESYGNFLAAMETIHAGEVADARLLLIKAVEADPDFCRARLNLGVAETMNTQASVQRLGMARLRALIEEYDSGTNPLLKRTDQWRARYALACALGNEIAEVPAENENEPAPEPDAGMMAAMQEAADVAQAVLAEVINALVEGDAVVAPAANTPQLSESALAAAEEAETRLRPLVLELVDAPAEGSSAPKVERELADSMVRPALLLLAGIFALTPKPTDPPHVPVDLDAFRRMAGIARSPRDLQERDNIQRLLDERDHAGIITFIGLRHMMSSTDAAYAGANYFALGANDPVNGAAAAEMATDLLGFAITEPFLKAWAPDDPVLKPLHGTPAWDSLFPKKKPVYRSAVAPAD